MKDKRFTVSSSPHIRSNQSTKKIMADVLISLIPASLSGIIFYGMRALFLIFISMTSCVLFEFLWQKLLKKPSSINDLSAAVTGLLLALNMPVTVPWWIVCIGAFFSIIIVKQFFGGLGCNFLNPAMAGRAFLLASWPIIMTKFVIPPFSDFLIGADVISSATPLSLIKEGNVSSLPPVLDMFIGNIGGCIGETSALALILGGVYLRLKNVITLRIPFTFIGIVALLSLIFSPNGLSSCDSVIYNVLGGGLILGAFFMATDYVTSPVTSKGQIIMAVGCGAITFLIRKLGAYPEGVTYGILLMNIATPLIDKYVHPKKFGYHKKGRS